MCVFLCPVSEIPIPDYEAESLESFLKKITGYKTTPQTVLIQLVWMGPRNLYFKMISSGKIHTVKREPSECRLNYFRFFLGTIKFSKF